MFFKEWTKWYHNFSGTGDGLKDEKDQEKTKDQLQASRDPAGTEIGLTQKLVSEQFAPPPNISPKPSLPISKPLPANME